jgi:colicin import membrane protein
VSEGSQPSSWRSVFLSVLLHGAIVGLGIAAYFFVHKPAPRQVRLAIDATVVRATPSQAPRQVAPEPVSSPPVPDAAEAQKKEQQEAEKRAAEQRAAEEKAQKLKEARQQAAEEKADKEKALQDKAAKDKAALAKAAQEKEAKDKTAKEKAAKEKADKEKAAQDKLAREKTQADAQRTQREADLNAQIAAEERAAAARASGQMNQYIAQITAQIERNWIRPASAQTGLNCEVHVTQVPGGTVTGVQVGRCNGDDTVRQSIEAAVLKASPLPLPADAALFERILVVTFRPEN